MGHIESTRDLSATPERVWAVLADPGTWEQWFSIHAGWIEEPPATLSEGAKLTEKIMMLGMANKLEWTVTEFDAPKRATIAGTGMAGVKTQFTFVVEANGGGSRVSVSADFEGSLIVGALGKAVEKDGTKNLEKSLAALADLAG